MPKLFFENVIEQRKELQMYFNWNASYGHFMIIGGDQIGKMDWTKTYIQLSKIILKIEDTGMLGHFLFQFGMPAIPTSI